MRERTIGLIVGGPGSGKSTLARRFIAAARNRGERIRIVDPARQFAGGVMPPDVDVYLGERRAARDVDFIVLDDADAYVPTSLKAGSSLRDLALRNRWWGVDVLLTARRLQSLPPLLLSAVSHLWVFRLSPADKVGRERLVEVAGEGLAIPTEPYRFVHVDVFGGQHKPGRTSRGAT
jgi:energy-coupling factor transporter ATP-binding protein EcfA2